MSCSVSIVAANSSRAALTTLRCTAVTVCAGMPCVWRSSTISRASFYRSQRTPAAVSTSGMLSGSGAVIARPLLSPLPPAGRIKVAKHLFLDQRTLLACQLGTAHEGLNECDHGLRTPGTLAEAATALLHFRISRRADAPIQPEAKVVARASSHRVNARQRRVAVFSGMPIARCQATKPGSGNTRIIAAPAPVARRACQGCQTRKDPRSL